MTHITLDLGRHCIATEVKRLHNRCISDCLKGRGETTVLEARLSLLTRALDELDLPRLRGIYPALSGVDAVTVVLEESDEGALSLRLHGEALDLSTVAKG